MDRSFLAEFFGAKGIVNKGTKEIHLVCKTTNKCRIEMITKGRYIWNLKKWEKKEYNGCRYCNPKNDRG